MEILINDSDLMWAKMYQHAPFYIWYSCIKNATL